MNYTFKLIIALFSLAMVPVIAADPKDKTVAEHAGKLDQWFTREEAAKIIGKPATDAEVYYPKSEKRPYTEVVEYNWKGNRKRMTTGALKMELPVPDSIKVGWLRKETLEEGKALREMTKAEEIADLGEMALFVKAEQQYIIYKNGVRFSLWINVSDDDMVNRAKALEIAKVLLAKL